MCAYGDDAVDIADAARLMRTIPAKQIVDPGLPGHNLLFELLKLGQLEGFMARALPSGPGVPATGGNPASV